MFITSLRNVPQSSGYRKTFLLSIPVVIVAALIGNVIGQKVSGQSNTLDTQKKAVLAKIHNTNDSPLTADNSEQGPLFIEAARTIEIEGNDFHLLTSGQATASNYVRFPEVKVTNNFDKRLAQLTVCMVQQEQAQRNCLRMSNLSLAPGDSHSIKPEDWALPNARQQMKLDANTGEIKKAANPTGLQSETMWLAGRTADFTVELQSVKFDDNSKWVTKR